MADAEGYEGEFDLVWRQTGPEGWVALLTDRKTGERYEARSQPELKDAISRLMDGNRRGEGTGAGPKNRRQAGRGAPRRSPRPPRTRLRKG